MRLTLFISLAYVCGVHGFALFAPYLGLFLPAAYVLWRRRRLPLPVRQTATIPTREM